MAHTQVCDGYDTECFYHRLSSVPLVSEAAQQALLQYEASKNYSQVLNALLAAAESTFQTVATKADQNDRVRETVAALSKLACKGLDEVESRYPNVKTVSSEQLKQLGLKYWEDSYFKHGITSVTAVKDAGVDKVGETKELVVSKVNGVFDYGTAVLDGGVSYVDGLVDSYIAEPNCDKVNSDDPLVTKVQNIGGKVVSGLSVKASRHSNELRDLLLRNLRDLQSSMAVIEYLQSTANWATTSASQNVDALKGNAASLLAAVQQQASMYNIKPELLLLRVVKSTSSVLATASDQMLSRLPASVLPETYATSLKSIAGYLKHIDDSFAQAQSLHDVKEDVVAEAKDKIGSWEAVVNDLFDRVAQYPPVSWLGYNNASVEVQEAPVSNDE